MKKHFIIAPLLLSTTVLADPYVVVGIGTHTKYDMPEIQLKDPIFLFRGGYKWDNGLSFEYNHISGVEREQGYGFNGFFINYTIIGD